MSLRARLLLVFAMGVLSFSACAESNFRFDLPEQSLADSLRAVGSKANVNVVFEPSIVGRRKAPVLHGAYSAREALQRLLSGSGLDIRQTDGGSFVIGAATDRSVRTDSQDQLQIALTDSAAGVADDVVPPAEGVDARGNSPGSSNAAQHPSAAGTGGESSKVEEIVVTAQKRKERLIDVPMSIAALSEGDLERTGARSISQSLGMVGGLNVLEAQPGQTILSIRGVSASVFTATSVAYYIDELPFSFINVNQVPDAGAYDVERVEVLRGPQGTLFGSNALAGVVRIITNDAALDRTEIKGRAFVSSTDNGGMNFGGDFAVNIPIVEDKLAIRAVASQSDLGGFIDSPIKRNINSGDYGTYRFKLKAKPMEDFTIETGVQLSRIHNDGKYFSGAGLNTQFRQPTPDDRNYEAYSLEFNYDLPAISIVSATNYMDYSVRTDTNLNAAIFFKNDLSTTIFTQEIRAHSNFEGPWTISGGGFYRDAAQQLTQDARPFFPFIGDAKTFSKSFALFGELSRKFGERTELTGGLRYFEDENTIVAISNLASGPNPNRSQATVDKVTYRFIASHHLNDDVNVYASVGSGFRSGLDQFPSALVPEAGPLEPDTLTSYEIGSKGRLLNKVVSYDVAAYYTEWNDIVQSLQNASGAAYNVNAGQVTGVGIDASLSIHPARGLTIETNVGWNDLTFADNLFSQGGVFAKGDRPNDSPRFSGGASIAYSFPAGGTVTANLFASAHYNSSVDTRSRVGGAQTVFSGDNILLGRLQAGLDFASGFGINLFADNVTNEQGAVDASQPEQARSRPRTIGLQMTFKR